MIELAGEPIPVDAERRLRKWFSSPECATLRRVVEAKGQFKQSEALRRMSASEVSTDPQVMMASTEMRDAAKYKAFLDVLSEMAAANTAERFVVAKLKTNQHQYDENIDPGTGSGTEEA